MGKYSVKGSPGFDARIDADMEHIAAAVYASPFSKHWKALVLLGGYGRGEGSPMIQRSGVSGQGAEGRGQGSEVRGQRSEVRGQRAEVRGQGAEVRGQESEVRGQRSEVRGQRAEVRGQEVRGQEPETELPFNDYDLVVVTNTLDPLLKRALKKLEENLSEQLGLPVDLYPYLDTALPKCEFSLLNYEMRYGHRVIRGDQKVLAAMPAYAHDAIPLSEGTRLLMNRGKLLLDIKRRLALPEALTREERQRFLKFMFKADLAFGDCALLLRGAYDLSYVVKRHRLPETDLSGLENSRDFICAYQRAIDFKERADFQGLENSNIHLLFTETVLRYELFFLWYERRRLNRKFKTLEKYAYTFPDLGKEGSPLKNLIHNLRTFGTGGLLNGFAHPRLRLYAALPLLLVKQTNREAIRQLLCAHETGLEELSQVFYALQQRFS